MDAHGHLDAPSSIICEVIVHDFAMATFTTGANTNVRVSKAAKIARDQIIVPDSGAFYFIISHSGAGIQARRSNLNVPRQIQLSSEILISLLLEISGSRTPLSLG